MLYSQPLLWILTANMKTIQNQSRAIQRKCAFQWVTLILCHIYAVQLRVLIVKHTISFFIILLSPSWKNDKNKLGVFIDFLW